MDNMIATSRRQKRLHQRIEDEAKEMHARLIKIFFDFFIEHDPNSDEVKAKAKDLSTKWKSFCHNRQLIKEAHSLVQDNCDAIIKQYNDQKNADTAQN